MSASARRWIRWYDRCAGKMGPCLRRDPLFRALLEAGAVAVDVIGRTREARAIAADDRRQRLEEKAVVGVGGGEAIMRGGGALAQPAEVDGQQPMVFDDHAAADDDAVHRGAVLAVDE